MLRRSTDRHGPELLIDFAGIRSCGPETRPLCLAVRIFSSRGLLPGAQRGRRALQGQSRRRDGDVVELGEHRRGVEKSGQPTRKTLKVFSSTTHLALMLGLYVVPVV